MGGIKIFLHMENNTTENKAGSAACGRKDSKQAQLCLFFLKSAQISKNLFIIIFQAIWIKKQNYMLYRSGK